MSIRDEYIQAVQEVAIQFGHVSGNYRVARDATLQQCIGYALKYVSGHSTRHYRYDRYRCGFRNLTRSHGRLPQYQHHSKRRRRVCPGLFAWVVHDYFRTADVDVELYGYDHSLEMVNLSALIQNELATDVTLRCYGQLEQLLRAIPERRAPANVIVTLATFGAACRRYPSQGCIRGYTGILDPYGSLPRSRR